MELDARSPLEVLFERLDHSESTCTPDQVTEILVLLLGLPAEERDPTIAAYFESENQAPGL